MKGLISPDAMSLCIKYIQWGLGNDSSYKPLIHKKKMNQFKEFHFYIMLDNYYPDRYLVSFLSKFYSFYKKRSHFTILVVKVYKRWSVHYYI